MGCKFAKPATLRQPYWRTTKLENLSRLGKDALTKLRSWGPLEKLASALVLLVLLGLLVGCGTTSAPPAITPRNPEPPPSVLPESPPNYLESARLLILTWQKRLNEQTATPAN
jgi:hypothetical protein